jgi:hypothetical protein
MEQFLREWRKDALNKNQHDAAIFIGDKLLALTSECMLYDIVLYILILRLQIVTKTLGGLLKSISRQAITLAPKAFYNERI